MQIHKSEFKEIRQINVHLCTQGVAYKLLQKIIFKKKELLLYQKVL